MKTILLVEDEAIVAMAVSKIIEKHGFNVIIVYTGEKAVKIVQENPVVSLILMDIDLGKGMDGTEASQEILNIREIPIVFHTSHAEKEYVDQVKKITKYGYVLKNSGEFVLIESINMAYALFAAKQEALKHLYKSQAANMEMEARENRLQHMNRVLLSIRNINQLITNESDISSLLDKACQMLIETSGYNNAWIVLTDEGGVPAEPFYYSGFEDDFSPMEEFLRAGGTPHCASEAIKTGGMKIISNPSVECPTCPFINEHSRNNIMYEKKNTMSIPLQLNDIVFGWINVILPSVFAEDPDEHLLFREIADDLSYAIHNLRSEEMKRQLLKDLNLTQTTLMTALENSQAGIAIASAPDGKLQYVNNAGLLIRGGEREEIVKGIGIDQYIENWHIMDVDGGPLKPDEVPLARAILYGEANSRELIVRREDKEDRIVIANAAPIFNEDGKVESGIVIFLDVTEHRETEKKLRESEEKYKALYENAPLSYQSLDINGNFLDVNSTWLKTLGYTREEVIGKSFSDFLHPSWKSHFEKNFPAFKKQGYVHDVQFKIRRKSGEYRDITFEGCIGYNPDGSFGQTYCVFKDITEQKSAERELQKAKENLQVTLTSIGDAVISTDVEGKVVFMNPVAERLTGWKITSAEGMPLDKVFHIISSKSRKTVENPVSKVLEIGSVIGLANHTMLLSRDGSEYQIADSASPIRDSDGKISGVVLVFRDVTEEYRIRNALRENEARLSSLFHSMTEGVCLHEIVYDDDHRPVDYRIIAVNPAYERILGLSRINITGKLATEVYESPEPPYFEIYTEVAKTKQAFQFETYYPPMEKHFIISAFSTETDKFATVFMDISEMKQAQNEIILQKEFLEQIIETSPISITKVNKDGMIVFANEKAEDILGLEKDEIMERTYHDVKWNITGLDGSYFPEEELPFNKVRTTGKAVSNIQHALEWPNGERKLLSVNAAPLFDIEGKFNGMVASISDITDQHQNELRLKTALEEKDFLMKELNHRVKNSLTMISSLITLKNISLGEIADLSDLIRQIETIHSVHEKLYNSGTMYQLDAGEYISGLLNSIFLSFTQGSITIKKNINRISITSKAGLPIGLIINEIATNAIKHGFINNGKNIFSVDFVKDSKNNQIVMKLYNTGNPFPENIDINAPATLGLQLVAALVGQLEGSIDLQLKPYPVYTIKFPIDVIVGK